MRWAIKNFLPLVIFWVAFLCILPSSYVLGRGKETQPSFGLISAQDHTGGEMRVLWTAYAYKIHPGAKWSENEARSLLFKPLDICSSSITFNDETCQGISFISKIVDTGQYLSEKYQTTPQLLGIFTENIQVVKTNCQLPGFSEYIRLRDSRIIVWIDGVFLFFEPKINK